MNVLIGLMMTLALVAPVLAEDACPCPPAPYDNLEDAALAAYERCQVRGVATVTFETSDGLSTVVLCSDPDVMFWEPAPADEPEEPEEPVTTR